MPRVDGRQDNELRPVQMDREIVKYAEGSCMIWLGDTQVLCAASVEDRVPPFLKGQGTGWVTAEYSMLPRATHTRQQREVNRGQPSGRTMEIQRLIGRALRSVVETRDLGERTITVDCDVIQADGGTRTASITGAYMALYDALRWMHREGMIRTMPVFDAIAAVSVGIVDGREVLDLRYEEDSRAAVDMNVVMTGRGKLVEVQGTAEGLPFSREQMNRLIDLAEKGIQELLAKQREVLGVTELPGRRSEAPRPSSTPALSPEQMRLLQGKKKDMR